MNKFDELIGLQDKKGYIHQDDNFRVVFAPDLGARVFCELEGHHLHRLDIENVRIQNSSFNNYGGNNYWPAPEGGEFGFNYLGDNWYVQPAINNDPFIMVSKSCTGAKASKKTILRNRKGTKMEVSIERDFKVTELGNDLLKLKPKAGFAYLVDDRIKVLSKVNIKDALIACWSLEQFDASNNTVSFAKVKQPHDAINFDYYIHPKNRIKTDGNWIFYKTDGKMRGQIGLKKSASTEFIGFYNLESKILCIREIIEVSDGKYFNIADNEQPDGPYSAMDNYSIFNGDENLGFFEIETIGCAEIHCNQLKGSHLISKTSFAVFEDSNSILRFIEAL